MLTILHIERKYNMTNRIWSTAFGNLNLTNKENLLSGETAQFLTLTLI